MATKIYAVRKGHTTGIFNTWDECKKAVDGFRGAEFKSFKKIENANAYLNYEDVAQISIDNVMDIAASSGTIIAYVDGSYSKKINKYAFGCIIITPNREMVSENGYGDDPDAIAINNVAGELKAAMFAARWAIKKGFKKLEIRHDYVGIAKWATGEWKANNETVKKYVGEMQRLGKLLNISFIKVDAHSGDPLNDEADKLAREALEEHDSQPC